MFRLFATLRGYLGYRGREGHWSFLLHRLTGLGTGLFLTIHILDTAMVYFYPPLYLEAVKLYQSTLFGLGEIGLIFCVLYHGVNGLRIAIVDMFIAWAWTIHLQRRAALLTLVITLILWLPAAVWMTRNLMIHNFGLLGG